MKNKILFLIIPMLIVGGLNAGAVTFHGSDDEKLSVKTEFMQIQVPSLCLTEDSSNNLKISIENEETYCMEADMPMLPEMVKTLELPFGVHHVTVEVTPQNIEERHLTEDIAVSPPLLPMTSIATYNTVTENQESSKPVDTLYPTAWYRYDVGCGMNADFEHVTYLSLHLFPVRYQSSDHMLLYAENMDIEINYELPDSSPFPLTSEYDLVIIAPELFSTALQPLVEHKNNHGVSTILKTTEDIYAEYSGRDKPEQIKYFIKDALEQWGIKYVLLVGGLNSLICARGKDDLNQGSRDWYVPVRYTNLFDNPKYPLASVLHDPGVISDLYYADIYKQNGDFESWDTNGDGAFFVWGRPGYENDTDIDFHPDVALGRLACVNIKEVETVVDKIITYESGPCDPSWFKKMIVVSGDGFLDQKDLAIQWDTKELPDGTYTINAQSTNPDGVIGPKDIITVTLDRTQETSLTFNHDDHLNPSLQNGYPAPPIAEIVSVSEGNILGNTDFSYTPDESEAYCNNFNPWANISYLNGILMIRGKSYDPQPYGNVTDLHVWITNDEEATVFSAWRNNTEMYYEGEWTTGAKALMGRGGALYYMPDDIEQELIWASNGNLIGQDDVLQAVSEGCGFLFFSGHGSPNVWGDHFPGVPGNRAHASLTGLKVTSLKPWPPFVTLPAFPMNKLTNGEKLPIAVIGGCHNSQFNVSALPAMYDILPYYLSFLPQKSLWTHGVPVPETFSWHIISRPNGGAIASMGNTGLGYGMPGKECTTGGGDSWITIEFFKQYGTEHHDILGVAYMETLNSYVNTFDMTDLESGHPKTVQQWVLLGDPSLKIGGYP
jgi:hypothetical protein